MKKKFNVLIIDDEGDMAESISICLDSMLSKLNVEVEYHYAEDEREAELMIESEKFDLVSLDGVLRNHFYISPFIQSVINLEMVTFSLSAGIKSPINHEGCGLKLLFAKNHQGLNDGQIIFPEDLKKIQQAVESKINYQVSGLLIADPIAVFSESYKNSDDSRKHAEELRDLVAGELIKNHIYFSFIGSKNVTGSNVLLGDELFCGIFVSSIDRWKVMQVVQNSNLKYWQDWFSRFYALR